MRIKRIELDGFKSYAQRQVIDNFDPQFNAITGLNGSGKSNILDGICFLLGITNLQQVRAANLADLVYKQGQAGVNRATVTVVFDNTDPNNRPQIPGLENSKEIIIRRQVIINGRNTYTINGSMATNTRVADLFKTVGMNVNNPHFLIMQGRVTKVLNMKPAEILSMVEEAAGVRMYEQKKQNAVRIIERKDARREEINKLIEEDILPRVEKLKQDRDRYLEFERLGTEIAALEKKYIAYDYHTNCQQITNLENESLRKRREHEICVNNTEERKKELEATEQELAAMEKDKSNSMSTEKKALESSLEQCLKEQASADSLRDDSENAKKEKNLDIERRNKAMNQDKLELDKKRAEFSKMEKKSGGKEQQRIDAEGQLARSRAKLEALAKGMVTDEEGHAATLDSQLTATRSQLSQLETKMKMADQMLRQKKPVLQKKKSELARTTRPTDSDAQRAQQLEEEIGQVQSELSSINYSDESEGRLGNEKRALLEERRHVEQAIDFFEARHQHLQFKYTDPTPNFDRSRVKGIVAKLIRVKDPRYTAAIEVVAGGKLFNIVVDRHETAGDLLKNGRLAKRVTILPLNKMDNRVMENRKLDEARRIVGENNVHLAKDLVEYSPELEPAMRHVFGNTLVCSNMDQAKSITFNRNIDCRTVTISGEDFKPTGVLTGGSRANTSVLSELEKIASSYDRLAQIVDKVREIDAELQRMQPLKQSYNDSNNRLRSLNNTLDMLKETLKNSSYQILQEEIADLEKVVEEYSKTTEDIEPLIGEMREKVKMLEDRKNNEKDFQEKEKKQAQKEMSEAQKVLESIAGSCKDEVEKLEQTRAVMDAMEAAIHEEHQRIQELVDGLGKLDKDSDAAKKNSEEVRRKVDDAKKALDDYNRQYREHDKAIRKKAADIEELKKKVRQLGAKSETLKKEAEDFANGSKDSVNRVQNLEKKHPWIVDEKRHFGAARGPYDFARYSYDSGKKELDALGERRKELESTLNINAMRMLGTAEEQCLELTTKRDQLEKDKKQLYDTIEALDQKKKTELITAHKRISEDFDLIFSTLLPGTNAKLHSTGANDDVNGLQGLEVKIAFNKKWKESLGELSGGQRSLVALSLILAMLKFKPAPIYILDEVDAALDVSHTQNIGTMIKKHFKESQFIIVSLKEGMFNNANVLYRTCFRDGTSTVTRHQAQETAEEG